MPFNDMFKGLWNSISLFKFDQFLMTSVNICMLTPFFIKIQDTLKHGILSCLQSVQSVVCHFYNLYSLSVCLSTVYLIDRFSDSNDIYLSFGRQEWEDSWMEQN